MVRHGDRAEERPSAAGGFQCHHCGREITKGELVVGVKNVNKPRRTSWDHVCAGRCADEYKIEAQKSGSASSTTSRLKSAISKVTGKLTGSRASAEGAELLYLQKTVQIGVADEYASMGTLHGCVISCARSCMA